MSTDLMATTIEAFVANVHREMSLRGWKQSELAKRCGLSQPRISEILAGASDCRLGTVDKLAKAFGVASTVLLTPHPEIEEQSA